jgi:transposase
MSKGKSDKIPYKTYDQGQAYLIPPRVDELIPTKHLVSEVIDEMDIERLVRKYQAGGGASRYHAVMMTKFFVYGYMTKVCSSRILVKAVRENVMFMWLSGGQKPDFRTLNDFRGKMRREVLEEIFVTAVKMLKARGYIKRENYFVDGTKIESAAGAVHVCVEESGRKERRETGGEIAGVHTEVEAIWEDENREYGEKDMEELGGKEGFTSRDVKELAGALRERLEKLDTEKDGNVKKFEKRAEKG